MAMANSLLMYELIRVLGIPVFVEFVMGVNAMSVQAIASGWQIDFTTAFRAGVISLLSVPVVLCEIGKRGRGRSLDVACIWIDGYP
jgi:hypothetical protein